ncbi:hypothetical protein B0H13DRAFT_2662635 [Mycena leptocephala]|nr:hypothetical protein B0H13DRAFT_2662635 [Mycena leptocephala]
MAPSPNSAQVLVPQSTMLGTPPVSVINLIPPELLCYIFTLLVLPLKSDSSSPVIPRFNAPRLSGPWILGGPWVFGQVCSHWRALSVSLPTLWTSITVFTTVSPRELSLLNIQLSRTGSAPLDLHIRFTSGTRFPPNFDLFDLFLARLVSYSARWRVLHLEFDGAWLPRAAFATLNGLTLPLLEELAFSGSGVSYIENYGFFTDAPALRRLVLRTRSLTSTRKITLPWAQLKSYKAFHSNAATHFRDLAGAANLVECDLDFALTKRDEVTVMQLDILTLPRLRRLAISCPLLLDRLVAPSLQSLYIVGPVKHVHPFLDRSGCASKLVELTLTRCAVPAPEIITLLQQTPGLTALMLDVHIPPAEIVAALMAPERLCPTLESLAWADFSNALDRGAFADMVVSRCTDSTGVHPLRSVVLLAGRQRLKTAVGRMRGAGALNRARAAPQRGSQFVTRDATRAHSPAARPGGYVSDGERDGNRKGLRKVPSAAASHLNAHFSLWDESHCIIPLLPPPVYPAAARAPLACSATQIDGARLSCILASPGETDSEYDRPHTMPYSGSDSRSIACGWHTPLRLRIATGSLLAPTRRGEWNQ